MPRTPNALIPLCSTFQVLPMLGWLGWAGAGLLAQVTVVPDRQVPGVFGGGVREIPVQFGNGSDAAVNVEIGGRLLQLTSSTAAPVGSIPPKGVPAGPRQVVLERFKIGIPAVRAETRFLIQWTTGGTGVVGRTLIKAYPTNLLAQLGALAGTEAIGVNDPHGEITPALQSAGIRTEILDESGMAGFAGKVAILGPFRRSKDSPAPAGEAVLSMARRGVAVVLLQAPQEREGRIPPSFRVVREGDGVVVQASPTLVEGIAAIPESQLNLIGLVTEALEPKHAVLADPEKSN